MEYKIGDKVRIKSLDWYNKNKDEDGIVELSTHVFTPGMSQFCGKIMTIEDVFEDIDDNVIYYMEEIDYDWTGEMIEGLAEKEIKPKFKVGDKIKLKSTLLNDIFGVIGYESDGYRITNISNGLMYFMSYSIEHYYELVEEESLIERVDDNGLPFNEWLSHKGAFYVPDGYELELKDENGNVINATKIVLEKKNDKKEKFLRELSELLNKYSIDSKMDMPDYVLAEYIWRTLFVNE